MKKTVEKLGAKQEKGITLISLIITMIVLLILAGVSIAMLTGENGILKRAEDVNAISAMAELREKVALAQMECIMYSEETTVENVVTRATANEFFNDCDVTENDDGSVLIINISADAGVLIEDDGNGGVTTTEVNNNVVSN